MPIPTSLKHLIESFEILPGVGEKTAERYAYSLEKKDDTDIEKFVQSILEFKNNIKRCSYCNCISDTDICDICSDSTRNDRILCIVEDSKNVFVIDDTHQYNGKYFVLNGLISPSNGINPEDLNIDLLLKNIDKYDEIILALTPSIEGEVTSLYIKRKVENKNIKISRLSYGISTGIGIEYLDSIMISKALEDRKYLS